MRGSLSDPGPKSRRYSCINYDSFYDLQSLVIHIQYQGFSIGSNVTLNCLKIYLYQTAYSEKHVRHSSRSGCCSSQQIVGHSFKPTFQAHTDVQTIIPRLRPKPVRSHSSPHRSPRIIPLEQPHPPPPLSSKDSIAQSSSPFP